MMGLQMSSGLSNQMGMGSAGQVTSDAFVEACRQRQATAVSQAMPQANESLQEYYERQRRELEGQLYKRDRDLEEKTFKTQQEKKKSVNSMKSYIEKHRDVLYTICLALVVDHFVLNGAIRHRIQRLIEAMLAKVEGMLGVEKETVDVTP